MDNNDESGNNYTNHAIGDIIHAPRIIGLFLNKNKPYLHVSSILIDRQLKTE